MSDALFGISATACYLPPCVVDIREWGHRTGQSDEFIQRLMNSGVRHFHDAAGETPEQMALQAVRRLSADVDLVPETVDVVIYAHTLQGSVAPPPRSIVAGICNAAGFSRATAFSVAQQNCASLFGALRVARAMVHARPDVQRVLLIGADAMPVASARVIGDNGVFSDGASAALLERHGTRNRVIAVATHATGHPFRGALSGEEGAFTHQYFTAACRVIKLVTQAGGLRPQDVHRIIPHNLNLPGWRRILEFLRLPMDKLYTANFSRIGHVSVSDVIINLNHLGEVEADAPLVLCANGLGGFSGAALLRH